MSFDTRNNSALTKRAEQVRRWEESDTNREPSVPKNEKGRKIKFSSGCVFLAACVSGDKDEVLRLLEAGADINTANVDGLTALHQACIDDNLEMVEFLVEHGADINKQDNEGWTPLHATSSCGFVSIARYLVENGADLTAINSDGELAIDLATSAMADYLQGLIDEYGIDCEKARQQEEQLMLNDAKKWLRSDASEADKPHAKTGATALHVAAAKGYTKVLSLLLAGRANVDKQDNDGWTPLHAAAHWAQKEAAEMLVDAMADMDIRNYAGQTAVDVADIKIVKFLEELKANNKRAKRRPSSQIRISDTIENHIETPTKLIRVEMKPDSKNTVDEDALNSLERIMESEETDSDLTDSTESSHSTSISDPLEEQKPPEPTKSIQSELAEEDAPWRRSSSNRTRAQTDSPPKTQVPEKEVKSSDSEVILRRTQSFENDEKFYQKYNELRARIKANSCPILPATQSTGVLSAVNTPNNYSVQRSASLKDHKHLRKSVSPPISPNAPTATPNTGQIRSQEAGEIKKNVELNAERANENNKNDSSSFRSKISPGTLFKNFFKSFVPPVRDEESETQRKAHAKRVRETRRSTQGVTLDEIKSAEELVKKKNLNNNNNSNNDTQNAPPLTTSSANASSSSIMKVKTNERTAPTPAVSCPENTSNSPAHSTQSCEEITASYTVIAPTFSKVKAPTSESSSFDSSSRVSATYTITPPIANVIPSISTGNNTEEDIDTADRDSTASISTTFNVPISNKKRLEELINTVPVVAAPDVFPQEQNYLDHLQKESCQLVEQVTEELRSRDKRSIFDIDNANSFTLAEKLRNEANKCVEMPNSSTDVILTEDYLNKRGDSAPSSPLHQNAAERRPSWRLKFDSGSKFKLEDASSGGSFPPSNSTIITSAPAVIVAANMSSVAQKRNSSTNTPSQTSKPTSPVANSASSTSDNSSDSYKDTSSDVTITLRRGKTAEAKENDKENDGRNIQATQAIIQRRRKPKRRSTGVVHLDMDDIDPEKQESADNDEKELYRTERDIIKWTEAYKGKSKSSIMSFRHSRSSQPSAPRRRSLSSSRMPQNALPTGPLYTRNTGYLSRPLSSSFYAGGSSMYQSPYTNPYGSRETLYNHSNRNGYYPNGNLNLHNPANTNKSYLGIYDRYSTSGYGTDRYVSPYSSYDNGIVTAGLSLAKGYPQNNSSYSNKLNDSKKSDYGSGRNSNLAKSKSLSISNTNINSYPSSTKTSVGTNTPTSAIARSQSLRDQERKSRSRTRNKNAAARSMSASSEKSEGYESGSEKLPRSSAGSATSINDAVENEGKASGKEVENGELIDYKALWEAAKLENEKLKKELKKKDDELLNAKAAVDRFTNATTKNSLSELEKREKRAMERKLSEMEEELKHLQKLKTDNERLRAENRALTRVVSKLTTSAQNQLHKKQ